MDADQITKAMPFFHDLSERAQRTLGERIRVLTLPPRCGLLQPGDIVSGIYFVAAGDIRVFYLDRDGYEGTLYRITPGTSCILALNCLFSEMRYPAWAEAGEQGVTCTVLDGPAAHDLLIVDSSFMRSLFAQVSSRLFSLLTDLEHAMRFSLESRLVRLLLELAGESGTIAIPHERLSEHLGTSREVVSRLIRGLAKRDLIEASYGKLFVLDRARLEALMG